MQLSKPHITRIILIVLLLVASVVVIFLINNFNTGLNPAQPNEETSDGHNAEGGSQLRIHDDGKLKKAFGNSITEAAVKQLYAAHYQKSSKLEREAKLVDLKEMGKRSKAVTIKFFPSGETMTAQLTINNTATNDFDIKIEGLSQ